MNVISLTRNLLSYNTVNPPGNEGAIAKFVGGILARYGFEIEYTVFEDNRLQLIAEKGLSEKRAPIVLSGHFDTVPQPEMAHRIDEFCWLDNLAQALNIYKNIILNWR